MEEKIYLYPVWVRIWHWFNALLFLLLVLTGLSMHFAGKESHLVPFDLSVTVHNISGIALIIAFIFFAFANRFTWNGIYYKIRLKGYVEELWKQIRFYLWGIFKKEPKPFPVTNDRKFNPLQQFSYVIAMYILIPLIIITGIGLLFPGITVNSLFGQGGLWLTNIFHQVMGFSLTIFWLIHLYFCTIGKTATSNFKSMIDGWH